MDELRTQPHSVEAEQSVVGSILLEPRSIEEAMGLLSSEDFYLQVHRDIYEAAYDLFATGRTMDPVTILDEMKKRGAYKDPDSRNYVSRLMLDTPTAANIRSYAEIVREHSLRRQVLGASGEVTAMALEPGADAYTVIDAAESKFFSLRQGQLGNSLLRIQEVLPPVLQEIQARYKAGGMAPGLPSGITELDEMLGGLMKSNFILVASRPGVGKTSIALNIAAHAARFSGKTVAFFSLEMSHDQLATRLLSSEARVSSENLLKGQLDERAFERLALAAASLSSLPLLFDDNADISVSEMKAKCRRVKDLGLIVIDYLQLMHGTPGKRYDNRTTEVGDISRTLKIMAKELNVPVLCLAQLSRESEKTDREPRLSDLRESGSIEQDADSVMFLRKGGVNTPDLLENEVQLIIGKNRHGRTGRITLQWQGEFTRFSEKEWKHDDAPF